MQIKMYFFLRFFEYYINNFCGNHFLPLQRGYQSDKKIGPNRALKIWMIYYDTTRMGQDYRLSDWS